MTKIIHSQNTTLNSFSSSSKKGKTEIGESSKQTSAPFNSTQFIMNDHSETNQYLDHKLNVNVDEDGKYNPKAGEAPKKRVSRARDSRWKFDTN